MIRKFKEHIAKNNLISSEHKVLLAISGGIDSMAMLYLFHQSKYKFSIAHCNFSLRSSESDDDELFVITEAKRLGIEVFVKRFNTQEFAKEEKMSIQLAARKLRYEWFRELAKQYGFTAIAVAHNRNDVAETMLINLCRGTGLKGLTGIKPRLGLIVRPILFATRNEIELLVREKGIDYREDSSNVDCKYARNRIRSNVIPELERVNAGAIGNLNTTATVLNQLWEIIEKQLPEIRSKVYSQFGNEHRYSIEYLVNEQFRLFFLLEELSGYNFNPSQILDIERSLFAQPGKRFISNEFQLYRDREYLVLQPLQFVDVKPVTIEWETKKIEEPFPICFSKHQVSNRFTMQTSSRVGTFDFDRIVFPIILRRWENGDWFIPLGMKGRMKISDFLINQKVPSNRKDEVYVFESQGKIMWVIGLRIDERFKLTDSTKEVLIASLD